MLKSIQFKNEYNTVFDNILNINNIKVSIISQPNKIMNSCLMGDDFKTGSQIENAKAILAFLDKLKVEIGTDKKYFGNLGVINAVRTPTENYIAYIQCIS
jgi:hypothetical protein